VQHRKRPESSSPEKLKARNMEKFSPPSTEVAKEEEEEEEEYKEEQFE
jgi:hypothetical protein